MLVEYAVQLQDQFNSRLSENWKQERTMTDWATTILTEGAEFIESLPWKWWKKIEPDYDNLKLEAVDLLHFIISALLMLKYDCSTTAKYIENNIRFVDGDYRLMQKYIGLTVVQADLYDKDERSEIRKDVLKAALATNLMNVLNQAISIAKFKSIDDVFKLYVFKNALNHLRQELGYKEGKYQKLWDGVHEDNYFMIRLAERTTSPVTLEEALELLREEYQKVARRQ